MNLCYNEGVPILSKIIATVFCYENIVCVASGRMGHREP